MPDEYMKKHKRTLQDNCLNFSHLEIKTLPWNFVRVGKDWVVSSGPCRSDCVVVESDEGDLNKIINSMA